MPKNFLETPIEYLKGVGPKRAELLKKELNIFTFEDMVEYYPFRYVDRSKFYSVKDIISDASYIQLKGTISDMKLLGKNRKQRLSAQFSDKTGSIELVWFKGIKWVKDKIKPDVEYIVFGKPSIFNKKFNVAHPEIDAVSDQEESLNKSFQSFYSSTEKLKTRGLGSKGINKLMKNLMVRIKDFVPETLSNEIISNLKFISRKDAILNIHFPKDQRSIDQARARLKFEELFFIQIMLLKNKIIRSQKIKGQKFPLVGNYLNRFYKDYLPFELTNAQKKVTREIRTDLGSGKQMNRLLQGDVGSGKTLVALMTILIALDNNFQTCFMAPTEILANQHFYTLQKMLNNLEISIDLLTGSTKTSDRKRIHKNLLNGSLQILVGTHALIEETVQFKNLGIVIIDEQHRFGVAQRAKLWKKNVIPPHILVMTATPIPRTLAMTFYGDLDFSVIDEMPPGRKSVKTYHYFDSKRIMLFGFLKKQINLGRQIYIVYPLIQESEKLDLKDLMDGYESIVREFPLPEYAISILHGKMKPADKNYEMQRFVKGETQIMVSTTVIEVGVDIPNASVMVIENAERFGLSQLHQLRGRVGRGADQSYCILMTDYKLTNDGKKRMETMVRTSDGFEIAEVDLKLRGPGDLQGTQQSGILDLKIADLIKDEKMLKYSRDLALKILKEDPDLQKEKNFNILQNFKKLNSNKANWSMIS
ncbi:MAG: ATP-dependent DNA helicase RecG [Bacteroidales bacterium]|nr:ATP-dependent DNA helicase RecG [Bacteroidales bacterium]